MIPNKIYNAIPDAALVCTIILACFLDRFFPIVTIIPFPASLIGWVAIVLGIGLAVYTLAALKSKRTSTDAAAMPSELMTRGPYSFSRNPFYFSYVIIGMGVAFALGSLTAFVAPVICFAVIHLMIIPLEERNLQKRFEQEYFKYKHSVRRWI